MRMLHNFTRILGFFYLPSVQPLKTRNLVFNTFLYYDFTCNDVVNTEKVTSYLLSKFILERKMQHPFLPTKKILQTYLEGQAVLSDGSKPG